jgi:riboflavin kinase/FMN adenylyltransferase
MWFRRKVITGTQIGRTLDYPTLNFHVGSFGNRFSPGVYACEVKIDKKAYKGALYFGPKMTKKGNVLEVFVLNFSKQVYGQFVSFKVGKKIRNPKKPASLEELKKQIQKDLESVV